MSHLSQYAKNFKDIQLPEQYYHASQQQQYPDDSETGSVGSVEHLDPLHPIGKHHPRRGVRDWPWKKYLPEQYALPTKEICEHDDPDHQCEFCGPPTPTKAAYLKTYQAPLPSLLE